MASINLNSNLVKTVMLKVIGDGGDANRMLDEIAAKAEALKNEHPELTVQVDRAKAMADAVAMKAEMRRVFGEPIKVPVQLDMDRGLGYWLRASVSKKGWGALASLIPGLGGLGGGGAGAAGAAGAAAAPEAASGLGLLGTPAGVAGGLLAAWASTPLIVSMLGGLVGGAGAFGAFKMASNANANLTALQATQSSAQQALQQAQFHQQYYPSAANAAAVVQAQQALTQANQAASAFQKANAPALGLYGATQNVGSAASSAFSSALLGGGSSSFISGLEKIINQIPAFITKVGPQLGQMFRAALPYVEAWVKILEGFASRIMPAVTSALQHFARFLPDVVHFFNGMSDAIAAVIRTIGKLAEYFGEFLQRIQQFVRWAGREWDRFGHDMANWAQVVDNILTNVANWFIEFPGKIGGYLADLGGMLWKAGVNAINSLINGISSRIGSLGSVVSGVASKVAGFFGLSPAKEGPLSGVGAPENRGRHFAEAFASGMLSGGSAVRAATAGLSAAAGGFGGAGGGYGGGGGALTIRPGAGGVLEQAIVQIIRQYVISRGGGAKNSVQVAFGQHS